MEAIKMEYVGGACEMHTRQELDAALAQWSGAANDYWLFHGNAKFPALAVMANGPLATAHYFPDARHPGFISLGNINGLDPDGTSTFFLTDTETTDVANYRVIPIEVAWEAAREFAECSRRPNCIEWIEL
ncbi:Imm1 family immunity protein [Paraburkholderia sp. EG287B]|uniref:Imm1 family immunity protein n=1 Tax=unclassified Paraburkholderia TaxID=2615204 RepID=UPI0034D3670B